jgi:hypothetical protein
MRCALAVLLLLLSASSALAQKGDWEAVKNLPPGTPISVKYGHFLIHNRCLFQKATDDRLFCVRLLYGASAVFVPPDAIYERKKIREVRLEHSDASNMAVGAAIGAVVGGALGAAGSADTHVRARVTLGLLLGGGGAVIGGFLGRDFPIRHGKVIYCR